MDNEKARKAAEGVLQKYVGKAMREISEDELERGRKVTAQIIDKYGNIIPVEVVSGLWEKRRKSNLIKWLMQKADLKMDRLAKYLGCSKPYLNNKFNRDSFSFEDIVVASYACDYTLTLLANDGSEQRRIDAEGFFSNDSETWNRISGLKAEEIDTKRAEYEQKKAELERMRKEYGFED